MNWSTNSWQKFTAIHMPKYNEDIDDIKRQLSAKDGIVAPDSINAFKQRLCGGGFIVQMGECAETFANATDDDINNRINFIEEFCNLLPVDNIIKIGRIAGQYSKPRSEDFEEVNGEKIPVYKGDMFHDYTLRQLDPKRMLLAYEASKKSYEIILQSAKPILTSHEALNLHYEEAMTRLCEDNKYYNVSAHMLWLGEKTRFRASAHVEYLRGIENPIGIKVSHKIEIGDLIEIIKLLNPQNKLGKIILISRMGVKHTPIFLENILSAVKNAGLHVVWTADPMHGNTYKNENNYKTRNLADIITEISDFAEILAKNGVKFGGIHLENSPNDIYECVGDVKELGTKYETLCDPRLNKEQSFAIAELLAKLIK
ncbi:MAG: 3-deoxy-7-phosphoheptulonate synthase [Alphaproteobacteria bacterium]|jgi:3-deoxy-7-phosphoheptulonate synthase|nr:3-deoxy-7-phosphoheptulonate synthase [Alphaproteobacteria bacterium]